jgi:hypothetical protein
VHADPAQMREFAAHVDDFGNKVFEEIKSLRAHFDRLDWHDAQRRRFADEVADVTGRLSSFLETANEIASKLRHTADPLDQYLDRA